MRNKYRLIIAGLVVAAAGGSAVAATGAQGNDAFADLAKAKISITQAIASAEQAGGGKATRAELEEEKAGLVFKVEVANATTRKVMDVHVDGVSGKVISSTEDHDEGNRQDEKDDD
jgi:uncharacterized membrane protein YkoI